VQLEAGPIGDVMAVVRRRLDPWLGKPQWKQGRGRVAFYYRFTTEIEQVEWKRLKVEVNSREHFSVLGLVHGRFEVASPCCTGTAEITTYELDELLGTKLRALYQRKKGRDLFDLWIAAGRLNIDAEKPARCLLRYVENEGLRITRAELEANLEGKLDEAVFRRDIEPLAALSTRRPVSSGGRPSSRGRSDSVSSRGARGA
jgi:hypothetical protein